MACRASSGVSGIFCQRCFRGGSLQSCPALKSLICTTPASPGGPAVSPCTAPATPQDCQCAARMPVCARQPPAQTATSVHPPESGSLACQALHHRAPLRRGPRCGAPAVPAAWADTMWFPLTPTASMGVQPLLPVTTASIRMTLKVDTECFARIPGATTGLVCTKLFS